MRCQETRTSRWRPRSILCVDRVVSLYILNAKHRPFFTVVRSVCFYASGDDCLGILSWTWSAFVEAGLLVRIPWSFAYVMFSGANMYM